MESIPQLSFVKESRISPSGCLEAYKEVVGKLVEHGYAVFNQLSSGGVKGALLVLNLDTGYSLVYYRLNHLTLPYSLRINILHLNDLKIGQFSGQDLEKILLDSGMEPFEAEDKK